jgi:hypothetical protein
MSLTLKLPKSARSIVARILAEDNRIISEAHRRAIDLREISAEEFYAEQEVARLTEADSAGKLNREARKSDSDGNVTITKVKDSARLDEARAALDTIRERKALISAAAAPQIARLTAARIEQGLVKYRKFIAVDRPVITLGKNERASDALARFREASLSLIAERKAVQRAPRTSAEVKDAAGRELDKLADRGLPKTLSMFHGADISWPRHTIGEGKHHVPDALAVVAFLMRDHLKKELFKLVDVNANAFPDAMSRDDQAKRLSELDSEIDAAERLEAAAVEAVIAEGGAAHHRQNADVLAVLSLRAA